MLQGQQIDLRFGSGADTKTDNKNTIFTNFVELKNSRMDQLGAVIPRGGFRVIDGNLGTGTEQAFELVSNGVATVAGQGSVLTGVNKTYGNVATLSPAALRGAFSRIPGGESQTNQISIAASSTHVCMAWVPPSNATDQKIGYMIVNGTTGEIVAQSTAVLAVVQNIKVVADSGDGFNIIYSDATTIGMKAISVFSYSTPFSNINWIGAPTGANLKFDAVVVGSNLHVAFTESGTNNVTLYTGAFGGLSYSPTSTTALTFTAPVTQVAMTVVTAIGGAAVAVFGTGGTNGTDVKGALFSGFGTQVGTTQTQSMAASLGFTPHRVYAYEYTFPTPLPPPPVTFSIQYSSAADEDFRGITFNLTTTSMPPGTSSILDAIELAGVAPISTLPVAIYDSLTYQTYGSQAARAFGSVVGTFGIGSNLGTYIPARTTPLPTGVKVGSKTFYAVPYAAAADALTPPSVPTSASTNLVQTGVTPKVQATLLIHDTTESPTSLIDATNGQSVYIGTTNRVLNSYNVMAGGWPEQYIKAGDMTLLSSGGNYGAGNMSFVLAKVLKSAEGSEYRTYSQIFQANVGANYRMQLYIRFAHLQGATGVELYRTEANGTIFYRAATYTSQGTKQDNSTDEQLLSGRLADINGAELPPELIPSARLASTFKDRIVLVTPDDPNTLFLNRPAPFPVGTSFSSGLQVEVSSYGGGITAIRQMDSALYIFKSNAVFTMYGDAPGATGENSTLTVPQLVFDGVGVTSSRGVILTPKGIVFKSGKGFYIIERNQQVRFIGAGPYEDKTITVTGCGLSQDQNEVYFSHSNGSVWVLNLDNEGWYEWVCQTVPKAMTTFGDTMYVNTDGGAVLEYDESFNTDKPGSLTTFEIPQIMTTGWIRFNNIRGFQRIRRAYFEGDALRSCNLTVEVMVDYKNEVVQTFNLTVTNQQPLQLDLHLAVQKCEAMAFRISTNRVGVRISGATLDVGVKQGPDKSRSSSTNLR